MEKKIPLIRSLGWNVTKATVRRTINNPKWKGTTKYDQPTAMILVDEEHILRVIFEKKDDIIRVITVHIARRGMYESITED